MTDEQTMSFCPRVATCPYQHCVYHKIFREQVAIHSESWFNEEKCPKYFLPLDTLVIVTEERELNA